MSNINHLQGGMQIRNFAIIAHVDHGKSTLADRFLEVAGLIKAGRHEDQFLDRNPISRERGITIKLAPVRMEYKFSIESRSLKSENRNSKFILNLIDTPGHVDFSYEVDRTLACVEGVILLVDASKGIQAQTVSNLYKAIEKNLVIIPAVNKIDLTNADVSKSKKQLVELLGIKEEEIAAVSAKTGQNVKCLLHAVIERIPSPLNNKAEFKVDNREGANQKSNRLQSLIFDSYYDSHRGVIAFVRIFEGKIEKGMKIRLAQKKIDVEVKEVGVFVPDLKPIDCLFKGNIGYVVTNLKDIRHMSIGDTIILNSDSPPIPGYKKVKPVLYASMFPTDPKNYLAMKHALEQLYLTDSAIEFKPIYSKALGSGFRVGFLGMLHADVVRERLEREYNQDIVLTPPQVDFIKKNDGFWEPYTLVTVVTPPVYLGKIMELCRKKRSIFKHMDNKNQIILQYEMPLAEMVEGFFDELKSISSGYATFDWEFLEYRKTEADKLRILLNKNEIEEFSQIVVKMRAVDFGRSLVTKLKKVVPRQQFEVRIQAEYKGKIIASERVSPLRKNVTGKLYGGDRSRKDKLLQKQKKGKKRMKMIGKVEIPKESFTKLFKAH